MLEFLKKIFQNEQQEVKKVSEIKIYEAEEWLNEKAKPLMEEVQQQIEEILMKVNEEIQRARINVELLQNAKLQNPNIPFKAKQYMEGNRKAYTRAINSFLGHMEINNKDYFYLVDFCKLFDELINNLNKSTLRSYMILQEFLAHETSKIAHNLKSFDALFTELKSALNNEGLVSVNKTREKIESLKSKTKQKLSLVVDAKNLEASLKLANEDKNSIIAEIDSFNKSEGHSNFLKLNEEKKNKLADFYNSEQLILQSFSNLERALRKYSHVAFEHEEIVLDYLKRPIETLANDKNLIIVEILDNLKKLLDENKIEVDDKKKSKFLEEINKLNRQFIEKFLGRYSSFKTEIEDLDAKIKSTGAAEKFRHFNEQLEDINPRIEKLGAELEKLKSELVKADSTIENLIQQTNDDLKNIFNEEIRVVI